MADIDMGSDSFDLTSENIDYDPFKDGNMELPDSSQYYTLDAMHFDDTEAQLLSSDIDLHNTEDLLMKDLQYITYVDPMEDSESLTGFDNFPPSVESNSPISSPLNSDFFEENTPVTTPTTRKAATRSSTQKNKRATNKKATPKTTTPRQVKKPRTTSVAAATRASTRSNSSSSSAKSASSTPSSAQPTPTATPLKNTTNVIQINTPSIKEELMEPVSLKHEMSIPSNIQSSNVQNYHLHPKKEDDRYLKRLVANKKSAQASRERKKALKYELEEKVQFLTESNANLATEITQLETENKVLKGEFVHLLNMINESAFLSKLMEQVQQNAPLSPKIDESVRSSSDSNRSTPAASPTMSSSEMYTSSTSSQVISHSNQLSHHHNQKSLSKYHGPAPTTAAGLYLAVVLFSFNQHFSSMSVNNSMFHNHLAVNNRSQEVM